MTSSIEADLLSGGTTVNPDALSIFVKWFASDGDAEALSRVLDIVAAHKPADFEDTYKLFAPVLLLLDPEDVSAVPDAFDAEAVVLEWATKLGLLHPRGLNAMLAKDQLAAGADWLMEAGADPNSVLDQNAAEQLTILGHVCRSMRHEFRDENTVRGMIREVLRRGEVPYSVKPRHAGDPEACDIFTAIMTGVQNADRASTVLFEAIALAMNAGELPPQAEEAIGQICLRASTIAEYLPVDSSQGISYHALSYARFSDPRDWEQAFKKLAFSADTMFRFHSPDAPRRLLNALVRDGARVDDIPAFLTDDRVGCTLLQAAAFAGQEWAVKQLIEAGADAKRTVATGSLRYTVAGLDATGLWEQWSGEGRSQVLDAIAAKSAIESVIQKTTPRQGAHR